MAEEDISFLMSELNLSPTQQPGARTRALNEDDTHKSNVRARRRRRPGPHNDTTAPRQNRTPNRNPGRDPLVPTADSSSKTPGRPLPTSANHDSASKARRSHIYIVQVMWPSEEVEGVYYSSNEANYRAIIYLNERHGINANEISEDRGRFGQATSATKATRRMWEYTGTLEILTRDGTPWIRVLKKPLSSCHSRCGQDHVYLSLDRSDGSFVIGGYLSQDEAWEACKKYWTDLSVCASAFELKDEHERGRAQAIISGRVHRWVLQRWKLL